MCMFVLPYDPDHCTVLYAQLEQFPKRGDDPIRLVEILISYFEGCRGCSHGHGHGMMYWS